MTNQDFLSDDGAVLSWRKHLLDKQVTFAHHANNPLRRRGIVVHVYRNTGGGIVAQVLGDKHAIIEARRSVDEVGVYALTLVPAEPATSRGLHFTPEQPDGELGEGVKSAPLEGVIMTAGLTQEEQWEALKVMTTKMNELIVDPSVAEMHLFRSAETLNLEIKRVEPKHETISIEIDASDVLEQLKAMQEAHLPTYVTAFATVGLYRVMDALHAEPRSGAQLESEIGLLNSGEWNALRVWLVDAGFIEESILFHITALGRTFLALMNWGRNGNDHPATYTDIVSLAHGHTLTPEVTLGNVAALVERLVEMEIAEREAYGYKLKID